MKNFFKKLAFVLAVALVMTTMVPATKASAATEPEFKYSGKVLYLGGDLTGAYEDTYRFAFKNAKGYTATWKSSNTAVATVDAESGQIQAVAVGTTYITATLTKKGADAVECKAKVVVKQNAEKVGFGKMDAVKNMAVGDTGKVNVYRQVGDKKVWKQADKATTTDVIKWTTSNPEVATVNKWGVVTAVASGQATITATATQSEGLTPGAFKTYTVTVAAGLTSAKQLSKDTVEVKFAGDLSQVANKDNVKIYSMVGTTKVNVVVKDVKFDSVDKTKAVVTSYVDFAKDTEYVVAYADSQASFKGANLSKDAVASLKITTTEALVNVPKTIEVKAYNADGVEIPSATVAGDITLASDNTTDSYLASDNAITFFNIGKTATITATYHTYKYGEDYKEIVITAQGVVTSVEKTSETIKSIDVFTVYNSANPDYTKASSTISVSDTDGSYKVAIKATNNDNKEVKSDARPGDFTFTSSDEKTLIITKVGDDFKLYPVKEGTAVVLVKFGKTDIGAYPVTIGAKRAASNVTAAFDKTNLNSNASAKDQVVLKVTAKDQFGADFNVTGKVAIEFVSGPKGYDTTLPVATGDQLNTFTFLGSVYSDEGTYQYRVKIDGKIVGYVSFTVKNAGDTAASYRLTNAGKSVDTKLNVTPIDPAVAATDTKSKDFAMSLASYTSNGYKAKDLDISYLGKDSYADGTIYAVVTFQDSSKNAEIQKFVSLVSGDVCVKPVIEVGVSGQLVKAPVGTYTVSVFEKGAKTDKPLIITNFTITDTQTALVKNVVKTTSSATTIEAAMKDKDVVSIKIGNDVYNPYISAVKTVGTGDKLYVSKVTVDVAVEYMGDTYFIKQDVAIEETFTINK